MTTRRIGLLVEYEGVAYHGSQRQPQHDTIEGRVGEAVRALTGEMARVASQGRTDAGAHARGQVMAFDTDNARLPETAIVAGLNRYLPQDIAVRAVAELPAGFDVRRRAWSRVYRYFLRLGAPSPLTRRSVWDYEGELDIAAMRAAAATLVGEHDFAAFAGRPDTPTNTVRGMRRATVHRWRKLVSFTFEATAFLPHQVRRTVGALVEVGAGRMDGAAFRALLEEKTFGLAGPPAPLQGLYLWRVRYNPPLFGGMG